MESITKILYIKDQKWELPRLTLTDLFSVCDGWVARREQIARELAKEDNLEAYEIYNIVAQIRTARPTLSEVIASAATPEGATEILKRSLAKGEVAEDRIGQFLRDVSIPDAIETARMLVLDVQDPTDPRDDKDKRKADGKSPLPENP